MFQVKLLMPDATRTISVAADEYIWDAALRHGIKLPALCHQGWCLTCAARLEGPGEVDQSASTGYFPQDKAEGFSLLCTAKPRSDLTVRTHQSAQMRRHRITKGLPAPYSYGLEP